MSKCELKLRSKQSNSERDGAHSHRSRNITSSSTDVLLKQMAACRKETNDGTYPCVYVDTSSLILKIVTRLRHNAVPMYQSSVHLMHRQQIIDDFADAVLFQKIDGPGERKVPQIHDAMAPPRLLLASAPPQAVSR